MIGLSQEFQLFRSQDTEGDETKSLHKNQLYDMVSKEWLLPPVYSKGLTREYLLQVKDGQLFRVSHLEMKQFEYNLTKEMQTKVGVVNNALLLRKLNNLMGKTGYLPLGFDEYNMPDEKWLYRVARFIDRTNIMEFFEKPAIPEPPLDPQSTDISRTHFGRIYASQWLYRIDRVKKDKKLFKTFEALSERYRTVVSMRVNADVLEHDLKETRRKLADLDAELHDRIGKAAFTYTAIEDPSITPELVISNGGDLTAAKREQLNTNRQLYALLTKNHLRLLR